MMLAYVLVTITMMEIILFLERRMDSVSLVMQVITVFFFVSKKKARNIAALRRRYHPSHNQRRGSYLSGTTPVLRCVAVLMVMKHSSRHRRRYQNCYY